MKLGRRYWYWSAAVIELLALAFLLYGVVSDGGRPGDALGVIEWSELLLLVMLAVAALSYAVWAMRRGARRLGTRFSRRQ